MWPTRQAVLFATTSYSGTAELNWWDDMKKRKAGLDGMNGRNVVE